MKTKTIAGFIVGLLCSGAINFVGNVSIAAIIPNVSFENIPAAELPAEATKLIKQAKSADLQATTISVVKAALTVTPTAALPVIAAISRNMPEMASVAAGTASTQQPRQAPLIARAAAGAAPAKAGKIVESVCRAVPGDYRDIAIAVAQAVPSAGKEILDGVCLANPSLKSPVQVALLAYGGNTSFVADILDQAKSIPQVKLAATTKSASTTPSSSITPTSPPRIPLSTTPSNNSLTPSGLAPSGVGSQVDTSGQAPTGGRAVVDP